VPAGLVDGQLHRSMCGLKTTLGVKVQRWRGR
jgi:hypothetical protein